MESMSDRLKRIPDYYIGRDPEDPKMCAVFEVPHEGGRRRFVTGGFRRRDDAQKWINYQLHGRSGTDGE